MSRVRRTSGRLLGAFVPRGGLIRLRIRVSLDGLVTFGMAALAVGLMVGYQVLSRIGSKTPAGPR